jgi:hypothetical protein
VDSASLPTKHPTPLPPEITDSDRTFGNTLSYLNANGTGGSSQPAILSDTTLLSSHEATLMTDQPCDTTCGYVQNGSVDYSKLTPFPPFPYTAPH